MGPCANLHGHNAKADILLSSNHLDERGMVVDFGDIKSQVKTWIDENLDHTMLLSTGDPLIPIFEERTERFYLMENNPTAENIAKLIFEYVQEQGFPVVSVTLWETDTSFARYSG